MANIKERLDQLRTHIQEPEFLEGKGLSNEVNIRIFCYDAEDEMTVRQFVEQITTDPSLACHLIECNLYETFLTLCDDIDIMDSDRRDGRSRWKRISFGATSFCHWRRGVHRKDSVRTAQTGRCFIADWCGRCFSIYESAFSLGSITTAL